jgi:hypothetical protein
VGRQTAQQLEVQQMEILQQYEALTISVEEEQQEKKKNKRFKKLFGAFFILLFVVGVFLIQGAGSKATYAILRTLAALLLLFYLVNPLIKWLLQKWAGKKQGNEKAKMQTLLDMLPELRNLIAPCHATGQTGAQRVGRLQSLCGEPDCAGLVPQQYCRCRITFTY